MFQSTRPVRGATRHVWCVQNINAFQSTRPVRGATYNPNSVAPPEMFQSTRPVRGATGRNAAICASRSVSIHAPRAGRDRGAVSFSDFDACFNPRAPCGARLALWLCPCSVKKFQSTRPVRGATHHRQISCHLDGFQSTRPVRGATTEEASGHAGTAVSIHAPRAGRDSCHVSFILSVYGFNPRAPCGARLERTADGGTDRAFQSTRPVRGATIFKPFRYNATLVSIHAPRAGRDPIIRIAERITIVSIHAPRAGRDCRTQTGGDVRDVSIHAPRAGRDLRRRHCKILCSRFNPRAPCGARLSNGDLILFGLCVSIHAPRAGRDISYVISRPSENGFNPRAPCGARPAIASLSFLVLGFNPRAPCGARQDPRLCICDNLLFQSTRPVRGATVFF